MILLAPPQKQSNIFKDGFIFENEPFFWCLSYDLKKMLILSADNFSRGFKQVYVAVRCYDVYCIFDVLRIWKDLKSKVFFTLSKYYTLSIWANRQELHFS